MGNRVSFERSIGRCTFPSNYFQSVKVGNRHSFCELSEGLICKQYYWKLVAFG